LTAFWSNAGTGAGAASPLAFACVFRSQADMRTPRRATPLSRFTCASRIGPGSGDSCSGLPGVTIRRCHDGKSHRDSRNEALPRSEVRRHQTGAPKRTARYTTGSTPAPPV
jgi:hypothetical protein